MRNYADVVNAYKEGRYHEAQIRKVAGSVPAGMLFDLSYTAGIPLPNYYASSPITFATLDGNKGVYKGTRSNGKKYIHKLQLAQLASATGYTASTVYVMDIVGYYPFVDLDSTDEQEMDNTLTLPRYTDGRGLRIITVMQGAGTANTNVTLTYIGSEDQEIVETTTIVASQAAGVVSSMNRATAGSNFFMGQGKGVKRILKAQSSTAVGAICALLIVRPLVVLNIPEIATPCEVDLLTDRGSLIEVDNDAYINLMMTQNATSLNLTPALHGQITFIWED